KGNYGQIYINLKGREANGCVELGPQYDRLMKDITAGFRELVDPENGQPLIGPIWRREDLYTGSHIDEAPDIQFLPADMTNKPLGTLDLTSNKFITPVYGNSGDHRMHGVMIGRGPELKRGARVEGSRIIDYAPTILHSFGVEIPADMDGHVLKAIFTDEYLAENPVRLSQSADNGFTSNHESPAMTDEESEEIRSRLKSLGYLG
ncbi:MAG TPA: phosphodiesterase, partial [Blastocatellia bacterium]|nr:phosphodiesterase [Blastocatellia bacterium]